MSPNIPSYFLLCILLAIPYASSTQTDPYNDCIPFQLNCTAQSINLGYPFRTADRPDYCGSPGFDVSCSNDGQYPTIQLGSFATTYRIKGLDLAIRTLTIVNQDFLAVETFPDSALNTTWDISPFNYTDYDQKLVLLYNCSSPILDDAGFTTLQCPATISGSYAYYATESIFQYPYQGCSNQSNIIYAALRLNDQAAMNQLMLGSNDSHALVEALKVGFEVTWSASNWWCSTCIQSGGRCGYNASDPKTPVCFCQGYTSTSIECLQTSASSQDPYDDCAPTELNCGGQSIRLGYPFRTPGRPDYCGVPGFQVSCSVNGYPTIQIDSNDYEVKQFDLSSRLLTVVPTAFLSRSCPHSHINTWDMPPYNLTDRNRKLTLFSDCYPEKRDSWYDSPFTQLSCSNKTTYHATESLAQPPARVTCSSVIRVALLQTTWDGDEDFSEVLREGFELTWSAGDGWCSTCVQSGGHCGYNVTEPKATLCLCQGNKSFPTECPMAKDVGQYGSNTGTKIIIGVTVAAGSLFIALLPWGFYLCGIHPIKFCKSIIFRKMQESTQHVEAFLENYGSLGPKRYSYSDIKKMTKSFNDKLGQGGYGSVFKGKLNDGRPVAVKVLSDSKGNGEEFINEVASIGRTHHVNIVTLLGFCSEGSKRALIYQYMPNGSLEKFIYAEVPRKVVTPPLGWEKLYEISIGIARGLEYLHRGCQMRIVHLDIKPHNILLDEDFCPKISDFGLAKLCPAKVSIISVMGARGTAGYIAPEVFCRNFGGVSSKSDVYSYGMMVLEMVGGRKNIDPRVENTSEIFFPHWVYNHLNLEGDLKECGVSTPVGVEIARKMILVGLWCIQTDPAYRPSITRVIEMLQGPVEDLKIPPKPFLSSPSRSSKETSISLT